MKETPMSLYDGDVIHDEAMRILAAAGKIATEENYATALVTAQACAVPELERALGELGIPAPADAEEALKARAHELLAEQGLSGTHDAIHLRAALRVAAVELRPIEFDAIAEKVGFDRGGLVNARLKVAAHAGSQESPIYHTKALRRAAAEVTTVGPAGAVVPDEESVRLGVRADELLIERGWAKRNRRGERDFDSEALATARLGGEADAYAEALESAQQEAAEASGDGTVRGSRLTSTGREI